LGLSFNAIARIYNVATSTVMHWVKSLPKKPMKNPNRIKLLFVELDEMWHYLHSKKTNSGYGELLVVIPVSSLIGNVAIATRASFPD
jgi:hypothetical protein